MQKYLLLVVLICTWNQANSIFDFLHERCGAEVKATKDEFIADLTDQCRALLSQFSSEDLSEQRAACSALYPDVGHIGCLYKCNSAAAGLVTADGKMDLVVYEQKLNALRNANNTDLIDQVIDRFEICYAEAGFDNQDLTDDYCTVWEHYSLCFVERERDVCDNPTLPIPTLHSILADALCLFFFGL